MRLSTEMRSGLWLACTWIAFVAHALALAFALSCLAPAAAHAYFYDVDAENPAQQELGSYGEPLYADAVPDGVYEVRARTTSRMCVIYADAAEAAARAEGGKERCLVSVSGGRFVALFYLSPAYTHVFLGSGQEASQRTDATGTDDSQYMRGVAHEFGGPDGQSTSYEYSIALPALNVPVTMATYSGGTQGLEAGLWYDRQVVFMPGDEMLAAISGQDAPVVEEAEPAEDEPQPTAAGRTAGGRDGGQAPAGDDQGADAGADADTASAPGKFLLVTTVLGDQGGTGDAAGAVSADIAETRDSTGLALAIGILVPLVAGAVLRVALFCAARRS